MMKHSEKIWQVLIAFVIVGWLGNALAASPSGKITRVQGKVAVQRGAGAISAQTGMSVFVGDVVQTEAGSTAKLLMSDGTMLNVNASSKMRVRSYNYDMRGGRSAQYDLVYGRSRARVPKGPQTPDIKFRTPSAVAGVRGTELLIEYDLATGITRFVAIDGELIVVDPALPGKEIVLTPGMSTTMGPGMAPTPPVKLRAIEIENLRQRATGAAPSPRNTVVIILPGTTGADLTGSLPKAPAGGRGIDSGKGNASLVASPENMIRQFPPRFTKVFLNIRLNFDTAVP